MRRKDREITDRALIAGMLDMAEILHIAVKNEPFRSFLASVDLSASRRTFFSWRDTVNFSR